MQALPAFVPVIPLPENRAALAALQDAFFDVVAGSAPAASPCLYFLHGPAGIGKTALVQGLIGELADRARVCVRAAADLLAEDDAKRSEQIEDALQCDLLIVEDLQHLPRWAEETLAGIVDARLRTRAPMLFTALTGPGNLCRRGVPVGTRLTTRFAAGLVVALEPWQAGSRLVFLSELARRRGLELPADTLAWLAESLTMGGRQLEGSLRQIDALQRLLQQPLTPAQLRAHFRSQLDEQRPTIERIATHVANHFAAPPRDIRSAQRSRAFLVPRQVIMYLARQLTRLSLEQIGAYFGGRDHTTVLHACRKIEKAMATDSALAGTVRRLSAELA